MGAVRGKGGEVQAFRGWRIVAAAFLTQAVAIGFTMGTFTFFVRPLEEAFHASRATITLGMSIMFATMGISLAFIGRELDRRSARAIMLLGVAFTAGSLLLLAAATQLWQMALLCVGIGLGIAMLGPVASSTVVANWFEQQRGRALGIANMGATAGPIFIAPIAAFAIASIGWRGTLVCYAVLTVLLAAPVVWLVIVNRPSDLGQLPDGAPPGGGPGAPGGAHGAAPAPAHANPGWTPGALLSSPAFWSMALTVGIVLAAPIVLSAHLEPYCAGLGIEPQATIALLMITAASTIGGTFLFGALADRIDLRRLLWTVIGMQAACWALLLARPPYAAMLAVFVPFGLSAGAVMPIYGSIIGRVFGPAAFGQVMGLAGLLMLPLHASAPALVGRLYDASGDYALAFQLIIAALALSAVTLAFLRPARAA
jgi:predicted MFS family arabinose efflux permease